MLSFLVGSMTMLSFAPVGWYPLALLLVVPLLYTFYRSAPRRAAIIGFCYGAGLFLTGTYWLYVSIHVFGKAPLALAIFLMIALVILMACYYAAAGWLIARLAGGRLWLFVAVAPSAWVSLEWLRGWFLSGFPWMTLGYAQVDSPLAGFAPVLGIFGVSLMLMLSASAATMLLTGPPRTRAVLAVIALLPWVAGSLLATVEWTHPAGTPVRTTIVQGGVSQDRKWLPEQFGPTVRLYSEALAAHSASDLVLWPEVAIPSVLDRIEPTVKVLEAVASRQRTTLLFGILESDPDDGRIFNSVVAIDGDQRQVYRKRHLVPFGEYFPVPDFVRSWMRMMNLPYSDISPGEAVQPLLQMEDGNRLSVAICYEDAYAAEQLYALPEASILVNVSNDAWFGDSIAPHQHLQIARMRALETGRMLLRGTNTGISAIIGPRGEVRTRARQFSVTALHGEVEPRRGATPYVTVGDAPVLGVALLLVLLAVLGGKRRRN